MFTKRLDARRARGLEHVDRALDVDARVGGGVGHRLAHVDLRAEVEDASGFTRSTSSTHRVGVADVCLDELGAAARERAVEVLAPAGREVVDDGHLVAALEQRVDEVRADEAGAACDECPHEAAA